MLYRPPPRETWKNFERATGGAPHRIELDAASDNRAAAEGVALEDARHRGALSRNLCI